MLKKFDSIWVETSRMKSDLESLGFSNVIKVNNFKHLEILSTSQLMVNKTSPLKLVIFSRIMQEKGVEDAILAINKINTLLGCIVFTLDLYGPIDESFKVPFDKLCHDNEHFVKYCGIVSPNDSVKYLKHYFALLFPTRFYTEGIPGTIIDSYASGVPVVASQWQHANDVIAHNSTGIIYEFASYQALRDALLFCANNPDVINSWKINCLNKSKEYLPEHFLKTVIINN